MKCHYTPEKHVILFQMSVEPQLGDFKIWGLGFGLGFAWGFSSFFLNFIVYCWKTHGRQYRERGTVWNVIVLILANAIEISQS